MAARRKFYKLQGEAIGRLLHSESFGHFTIIGPREDDGNVLILRRTPTVRNAWVMLPEGTLRQPNVLLDTPRSFGGMERDPIG